MWNALHAGHDHPRFNDRVYRGRRCGMNPDLPVLKILLVKMSSMGDLVHNLPVVTDIITHFPDAQIDWVAEEDYVPIPSLHPRVRKVLPVALRRWRRSLLSSNTRHEMATFRSALQATDYDLIIDTQGLLKSALLSRFASGKRIGGDRRSIKEPFAAPLYDRQISVACSRHVIDRCRAIAAGELGYAIDSRPVFGIQAPPLQADWLPAMPYCVLMHAASRPEKLWSEVYWSELGRLLASQGLAVALPWGSQGELARSRRLADLIPGAFIPPRMDLTTVAGFLSGSRIVVGLDTGFTHFAAALARPTVGIFCDSDSVQAAVFGDSYCASFGQKGVPPDYVTILQATSQALDAAGQ